MHIDYEHLYLETESDVEQKFLMPLLNGDAYLGIPERCTFTKQYLAPTTLDKGTKKTGGYFPDYSIWFHGLLVMVVEAKAPGVPPEDGYRDAGLYARHINQNYPTSVNPCRFMISSNGEQLLFGFWDSLPVLSVSITDLRVGSAALTDLRSLCSATVLETHAIECLQHLRQRNAIAPYNLVGGPAILNAKVPVNAFAADLSPVLQRYFSSAGEESNREIVERAYVNSAEVTEYDRIMEALLKDRLSGLRGIVQDLHPTRYGEEHFERALIDFDRTRPQNGQLQIIQGAVGSGKSLFMRRYQAVLQSAVLVDQARWAFIDFNTSPAALEHAELWLCRTFIESFEKLNPTLELNSASVLRGIFARNIQRRKAIYQEMTKHSPEQAGLARANDLAKWQDNPEELATGLADYIMGMRRELLIVVMDNVDKLDLINQLTAFQLALWFMNRTKSFVVLQMRDETYERYKDKPPLDTYRTSITFHIIPPRFVDVVKKRLELSMEYLAANANEKQSYVIESGVRISYPRSELGTFLRRLYLDVFDRRRNVSRVLEALAGRNIRRALDMFVSIITSGHVSSTAITSTALGGAETQVTERDIIKILMRTGYRFFSDQSGFIFNIFTCDPNWQRPDNFLISELLYYLAANRKQTGQIGLEGYFTCRNLAGEMQRLGYPQEDTLAALNVLLRRELISADHMNYTAVGFEDSVRVLPSGYIHVRVLASRLEYLYGILPSTPIFDKDTASELAHFVELENNRGELMRHQKARALDIFFRYLVAQKRATPHPLGAETQGTDYVLSKIEQALRFSRNIYATANEPDSLDSF